MTYSLDLKAQMVAKLLNPDGPSILELAEESSIPKATLSKWKTDYHRISLKQGVKNMPEINEKRIRPQNWSAESKLKAVIEAASMTEEEIGAYCREKGIYSHYLSDWQKLIIEGLKPSVKKEQKIEIVKLKAENKTLNRELARKDKALAETSALLVLKKKANLIWGDGKDD